MANENPLEEALDELAADETQKTEFVLVTNRVREWFEKDLKWQGLAIQEAQKALQKKQLLEKVAGQALESAISAVDSSEEDCFDYALKALTVNEKLNQLAAKEEEVIVMLGGGWKGGPSHEDSLLFIQDRVAKRNSEKSKKNSPIIT